MPFLLHDQYPETAILNSVSILVYTGVTERMAILVKNTGGGIGKLAKKVKTAWSLETKEKAADSHQNQNSYYKKVSICQTLCRQRAFAFSFLLMPKVFHAHYQSILVSWSYHNKLPQRQ